MDTGAILFLLVSTLAKPLYLEVYSRVCLYLMQLIPAIKCKVLVKKYKKCIGNTIK
jgi:hypothetical protein